MLLKVCKLFLNMRFNRLRIVIEQIVNISILKKGSL